MMKNVRTCAAWELAVVAILLSPIVLIFAIPLAVGIGLDIFDLVGEGPVALALGGPAALLILLQVLPRIPLRQLAAVVVRPRLALGHAAAPNYSPKSIS